MYSCGKCRCGAVSIGIDIKPFLLYNCYCSHCRAFGSRYESIPVPYHSAGAVFQWNVVVNTTASVNDADRSNSINVNIDNITNIDNGIEYERTTALFGLFAMKRCRCSKCKQPIIECGERLILPFAMVMATPLLPKVVPNTDIYYDSRIQSTNDDSRNTNSKVIIRTDWGSLLYEIYLIIFVAIPSIPWSLYKRFTRKEDWMIKLH